MFDRLLTNFKEFMNMIARLRVQKATKNIEDLNQNSTGPSNPNLTEYLKAKSSEEVRYGGILDNVENTAKNTTAVKGTDTRPQS